MTNHIGGCIRGELDNELIESGGAVQVDLPPGTAVALDIEIVLDPISGGLAIGAGQGDANGPAIQGLRVCLRRKIRPQLSNTQKDQSDLFRIGIVPLGDGFVAFAADMDLLDHMSPDPFLGNGVITAGKQGKNYQRKEKNHPLFHDIPPKQHY